MTTEGDMESVESRPDETGSLRDSAPRRTLLAAERTYLAWLRTGLGAIGVALAVGRLVPALVGGSHLAYGVLGAGYGVLGIFLIAYAVVRARRIEAALAANAPITLDWWALAVTTVLGLALAIATVAMVLAEA
jgi:putative membrane protein